MVTLRTLTIVIAMLTAAPAWAAELNVIAAGAVRGVLGSMIDDYSQQTGQKFSFTIGPTGHRRR
jgi:ABC-type molybdate transport system substrate-binding protein